MCDRKVMQVNFFVSGAGNKETGSVILCKGSRWFSPYALSLLLNWLC